MLPGFVPAFSKGHSCFSVPVESRMDELNYCRGSRVGHELPAGFSGQNPPSLGTELTLQGVSDSWDQFGTHPWEENVLWNNLFGFFFT